MENVYKLVTDRFIEELNKGIVPWKKSWSIGKGKDWAYSHVTGERYSFYNFLLCGLNGGEYLTYRRAIEEGGHVVKGAKASVIIAASTFVPKNKKDNEEKTYCPFDSNDEEKEEKKRFVPFIKAIRVFPLYDTEGVAPKVEKPAQLFEGIVPVDAAEKVISDYIKKSGVKLQSDSESNGAFYSMSGDSVVVPKKEQFRNVSDYYATVFHELAHSTGVPSRLNRYQINEESGNAKSESYSREELVAEITAANVLRKLGLDTPSTWQNSAAYVGGWIEKMSKDSRFVVFAAMKAEKAANMILGIEEEKTNA